MVRITTPRGPVEVEPGAPFAETVKRIATEKGMANFRVILNDAEIEDQVLAPATIGETDNIVIFPFDKAG